LTTVWRIGYCADPTLPTAAVLASLGHGSTLGNGRWHTRGRHPVVYAGPSRALCQLEKRVHCNGANPRNQALMRLDLPADAVLLDAQALGLPPDWREDEAGTQALGMAWASAGSSLGLWVPSYIEPAESNLLINPAHPQYGVIRVTVERHPFRFDPRLFGV
jgi:RES domain-containing protein